MENQEKKLNLYQKLVEVRKQVLYIKKEESGYNFKYAGGSDILGAIRTRMDELNLLLIPNMESFELVPFRKGNNDIQVIKCEISYTWIDADNPQDKIETSATYFDDKMTGCQGVGAIMTYAERYFLYKFFQVATDQDSPEQFYKRAGVTPFIDEDAKRQQQASKKSHSEPNSNEEQNTEPSMSDEELSSYAEKLHGVNPDVIDLDVTKRWLNKGRSVKTRDQLVEKINVWLDNPTQLMSDYNTFASRLRK